MNAATATLSPSDNPYDVYGVLSGAITNGVVLNAKPRAGMTTGAAWLKVTNELSNGAGTLIRVGGGDVSATNGYPVYPGGEYAPFGAGTGASVSLSATYVAVAGNANLVVSFAWE